MLTKLKKRKKKKKKKNQKNKRVNIKIKKKTNKQRLYQNILLKNTFAKSLFFQDYRKIFVAKLFHVYLLTKFSLMIYVFLLPMIYLPVILETKYLLVYNFIFTLNFGFQL